MATFLDVTFLQKFTNLFIFLLVMLTSYAILEKSKFFGTDKKALNALISFFLGLMILLSTTISAIIRSIIPIFLVLFVIIIFFIIGVNLFGEGSKDIMDILQNKEIGRILIIIMIIIVLAVIFKVNSKTTAIDENGNLIDKNYTEDFDRYNQTELDVNYKSGVFNPKIIGLIMVLLIGAFTVRLLAGNNAGK